MFFSPGTRVYGPESGIIGFFVLGGRFSLRLVEKKRNNSVSPAVKIYFWLFVFSGRRGGDQISRYSGPERLETRGKVAQGSTRQEENNTLSETEHSDEYSLSGAEAAENAKRNPAERIL